MKIINNKMVLHSLPEFANIIGIIFKEEFNKEQNKIKFNIFEINNYIRNYSLNLNSLRNIITTLYEMYKDDVRSIFYDIEYFRFYKDNCIFKLKNKVI